MKKQGIKEDDIDEAIEDILFEKHVDLVLPEDDENVNETEGSSESYEEDEKEYQSIKNAKLKSINSRYWVEYPILPPDTYSFA